MVNVGDYGATRLRRDNSDIAPLKRDGLLHSDPKTKAELLNNKFSGVFTSEDKINMPGAVAIIRQSDSPTVR